MGTSEIINKATQDHLNRLVMDGTVTIGNRDSKCDMAVYLRSGKFMQFQANLHRNTANTIGGE